METFRTYFAEHRERIISEWKEFLSFKSISTDPAYHSDCVQCAKWLVEHLKTIGFECELWSSDTKPLVYGVLKGSPTKKSVLFYGHYDVQPIDPIDLWESDPFTPTLRDGRMYARGAEDNKGQVFFFIKALEALRARNVELPTIKILIEGEEESGSEAMHAGLSKWSEPLAADYMMVCDTGMVSPGTPTITMGLRGIAAFEVRVHGPNTDLHSGMFGGMVLNPLHALVKLLTSLHNEDGSIAVPGFYDGATTPSDEDRALANKAPVDVEAMSKELGVPFEGGERKLPPMERRGFRPTLEINGVGGGYQGAGGKTVIPSWGMAKISMRLVGGQDPHKAIASVTKFLRDSAPKGVRVEILDESVGGPALLLSTKSEVVQRAARSLKSEFGKEPAFIWEGASIPIITKLWQVSKAEPLLIGFGLKEDRIHAPNESFSLEQFEQGYRYVTSFLSSL
jgi:acetylornithine deacetylase/succinyl-diaminopimelate desuccinylase-like protein